jgi:predicted Zn finger-like uncharacterized protein
MVKVTCPHCHAGINAESDAALGTRVKCLHCGARFMVTGHEVQTAVATGAAPAPGVFRKSGSGQRPTATPVALPFAPPPAHADGSQRALILGLVFGALALFLVAGIGGAAYCVIAGNDAPPAAPRDDTAPDAVALSPVSTPRQDAASLPRNEDAHEEPPAAERPAPPPAPAPAPEPPPAPARATPARPQAAPAPAPARAAPKGQQDLINEAIDRGAAFLKRLERDGSWGGGPHAVGYAALPGLTLLECGLPKSDAAVQRAAGFVRLNCDSLTMTYDLALAILFLDRLGDSKDRPLIRELAGRLIAGQNELGGWTYNCRLLSPQESFQLLTFLEQHRPGPLPTGIGPAGPRDLNPIVVGKPTSLPQGITGEPSSSLPTGVQGANRPAGKKSSASYPGSSSGLVQPLAGSVDGDGPKPAGSGDTPKPRKKQPVLRLDKLLPTVRSLPVISGKPIAVQGPRGPRPNIDDNSNSQFAMLALWVARRHEVAVERTMAMVHKRYHVSQHPDGGWGYHTLWGAKPKARLNAANAWHLQSRPPMTCVGLLGLAMGHGVVVESRAAAKAGGAAANKNKEPAPLLADPAIQGGLRNLGAWVGRPTGDKNRPLNQTLYALWSCERVAVLYNLKTIGGKDWYGWAVEMLLPNQRPDGSWLGPQSPGFSPTVDTCLALLILKRSNLVQDLSENLGTYIAITDPDVGGGPGAHKK